MAFCTLLLSLAATASAALAKTKGATTVHTLLSITNNKVEKTANRPTRLGARSRVSAVSVWRMRTTELVCFFQ